MIFFSKRFNFIIFIFFLALALLSLNSNAEIFISNPTNDTLLTDNFTMITVNVSDINVSSLSFYYRKINESIDNLLIVNNTQNLSSYQYNWNITLLDDFTYLLKVVVDSQNYFSKFYLDRILPNITSIELNQSVFNNESYAYLFSDLNESNYSMKEVNYSFNNVTQSLNWNNSINKWDAILEIISNSVFNNLTIRAVDFANNLIEKNISFLVDLNSPIIDILEMPIGNKTVHSLAHENTIEFNISDDINMSFLEVYYDDILLNSSDVSSKYYYNSLDFFPNVGRHNITIIAKDIFNKTIKYENMVYYWFGSISESYLVKWENFSNQSNSILNEVYIAKKNTGNYFLYERLVNKFLANNDDSGLVFNSTNFTVEFLDIESDDNDFLEFNFNRTPIIYFNNDTLIGQELIDKIQGNFTTSVIDLIYVDVNTNKTAFIQNHSKYFARTTLPKDFSNLSNYDTIFYFENDSLINPKTLYQNDTCEDDEYPFSKEEKNPCYLIVNNKTVVYAPKHGVISANKDDISPKIFYNSFTHNNSINLFIDFSVSEPSYCNATIIEPNNNTLFLSASDLTDYYHSFGNRYFDDGDYNLTISCVDYWGNVNSTNYSIVVADIIPPQITINSPNDGQDFETTSANSYTFTIDVLTDEISRIIYKIDTGFPEVIEENTTTATKEVTKPTGNYMLTIYAEDLAGLTSQKVIYFSIDARIVEVETQAPTSSIQSGIIVSREENTTITKKESKSWYNLEENKKVDMTLTNSLFDLVKISFLPDVNVTNLKIEAELIDSNYPINIKNNSHRIYQYYKITQSNNNYKVKNPEFTFRVQNSWMRNNNIEKIIINRYSDDSWTNITPEKTGSDSVYSNYRFVSSGFSYYVITGVPFLPKIEKPTLITNVTVNETKDNITDYSSDISTEIEKKNYLGIFLIFVVLTSLIAGGVYSYKTIQIPVLKYEDLTNQEKEKLKDYISKRLSAGIAIHKIEAELIDHGWSQDITSKIVRTVKVPLQKEKELRDFIEKMRQLKNISDYDLKKALINVGWQPEIVENILKKK